MENLAPELLLPIVTGLPNLESLSSLLRASPATYRLFDTYGREIFEAVLSSGVIHEYTCALIRILSLIRTQALPPQAHDRWSLGHFIRHETTRHRYDPPLWDIPGPVTLPLGIPATVLRGLLATHRKLARLTVDCLKYYLERFNALRPSHLLDPEFKFESGNCGPDEQYYVPAWQLKPTPTPFPVHDVGPPSWIEEQRVFKAFWRIQLWRELKSAVNSSSIIWPQEDIDFLARLSPKPELDDFCAFYNVPIINLLGQNELEEERDEEPFIYQQETLLEHELLHSVWNYEQENREVDYNVKKNCLGFRPPRKEEDLQVVGYHTSETHRFFHYLSGSEYMHEGFAKSPLQHVSFEPFRNFGFAIWDTERMCGYGFLNSNSDSLDNHSFFLAWRSILGTDELAEVERQNREWERQFIGKGPEYSLEYGLEYGFDLTSIDRGAE